MTNETSETLDETCKLKQYRKYLQIVWKSWEHVKNSQMKTWK